MLAVESRLPTSLLSGFVEVTTEMKSQSERCERNACEPSRIIPDPIWPAKYLVEAHACWSLSKSKVFHGELPVQSQATKELILQEAILWHAREQESEKWKAFQV
jgi:hypothetical protein